MNRFKRYTAYAGLIAAWWATQALADYTLPTASGPTTFGTFVSGTVHFVKTVLSNPSGVQLGTTTNPLVSTISAGGNTATVSAGGNLSVNASQINGVAISATNPLPKQLVVGSAFVSASNPSPIQLSQGGAVLSNSNTLPFSLVVAGSTVSTTNRMPATNTAATPVTYSYTSSGFNMPANYQNIISLQGSSTKVVKLIKAGFSLPNGCSTGWISLQKQSTSGTPIGTPTPLKHDVNDPSATAVVRSFDNTAASQGTITAYLRGANVVNQGIEWSFGKGLTKPITLRGLSEYIALNGLGSNASCSAAFAYFEWTEE